MGLAGGDRTLLAPDLPGHGGSSEPKGDYSLGSYAAWLRDFLIAVGHDRATVVGHSLGGGIAMQFAYQFPELTERLVLVSSGGLGRQVHALLRAASLPGSEFVLQLMEAAPVRIAGQVMGRVLGGGGLRLRADLAEMARGYESLKDAAARQTFVHSLRSVIGPTGQRASAVDRLYLAAEMPTLIIWGKRDPVIPVRHGSSAHKQMPGSRLELFEHAGHFPQLEDPQRFTEVLADFLATTNPSAIDTTAFRRRLQSASRDGGCETGSNGLA